jgi:HD-GYP domain-containing protein (c-di-GMP phosphodiesterase class II)
VGARIVAAKKQAEDQAEDQAQKPEPKSESPDLRPAELLAAAAYMTDILPNGCLYHAWRVALVAEHIASALVPEEAAAVFYAGLVQDVGTVGAYKHITQYSSLQKQMDDPLIRSHPRRGAALLDWLPGMSDAAKLVRSHHEWWDGRGYPDGKVAREIPVGSQILLAVETMDAAGCLLSSTNLVEGLRQLTIFTGHAWSKDVWAAVVHSVEDAAFYESVMDPTGIQPLISDMLTKRPLPPELDCAEGVERVFHVFAALVDAKDPSTSGHSLRAAKLAEGLATHLGLSADEVQTAYRAGLVHDCGRLGVPTPILRRSGRLNEEEMGLVRKHAQMTTRVMSCIPNSLRMALIGEIAGHDHERYDGTGYPDRLTGENIHILSRILSVADAFDAMTSATSYKHLLSPRFAVIRLKQAAGSQFDPKVVEAMTNSVEERVLEVEQSAAA